MESERGLTMAEVTIKAGVSEEVVLNVLARLKNGQIDDAIACFAEKFTFDDHGIGLEFKDRERLTEFFQKTRELFPDSCLEVESILIGIDHVVGEWTLRTSVTEPFYGALARKVSVVLNGVSVVRTRNAEITEWSDYYDGLTSRRTALASSFKDWVEL
jgi:steroid delta-isomerase-like uncharacterized protein